MRKALITAMSFALVAAAIILARHVAKRAAAKPVEELNFVERTCSFVAISYQDAVEGLRNLPKAITEFWVFRDTPEKLRAFRRSMAHQANACDLSGGSRECDSPEGVFRVLAKFGDIRRTPTYTIEFVQAIHPSMRERWVAEGDTLRGLLSTSRKYAEREYRNTVSREFPIREAVDCAELRNLEQEGDLALGTLVYYVEYDYLTRQCVSRERPLRFHRADGKWFLAIESFLATSSSISGLDYDRRALLEGTVVRDFGSELTQFGEDGQKGIGVLFLPSEMLEIGSVQTPGLDADARRSAVEALEYCRDHTVFVVADVESDSVSRQGSLSQLASRGRLLLGDHAIDPIANARVPPAIVHFMEFFQLNSSFLVFPGRDESGQRLCDPRKPGTVRLEVDETVFAWRLPLKSLSRSDEH